VKTVDLLKPREAEKGRDFAADWVSDPDLVGERVFVTVRVLDRNRDLWASAKCGLRDAVGAHGLVADRVAVRPSRMVTANVGADRGDSAGGDRDRSGLSGRAGRAQPPQRASLSPDPGSLELMAASEGARRPAPSAK
jgi:hypothetical protein